MLRRALLFSTGTVLLKSYLPAAVAGGKESRAGLEESGDRQIDLVKFVSERFSANSTDLHAETIAEVETYLLTQTLEKTSGNQSEAAKILGITRGSLRHKIRTLGISIDQTVSVEK